MTYANRTNAKYSLARHNIELPREEKYHTCPNCGAGWKRKTTAHNCPCMDEA